MAALLPDQVPDAGQGVWASFFGKPAYTLTLPKRLAEQTNSAVILFACLSDTHLGGWRLHLQRMNSQPSPELLNAAMQDLILRWPQHYLWGYNRYKQPPGAKP